MARILYIHWHPGEAAERAKHLREAGHRVTVRATGETMGTTAKSEPEILVISLDRLPAHGRAMAAWWWEAKSRRHVPIVFDGGKDEAKVLAARDMFPGATWCRSEDLLRTIGDVLRTPATPEEIAQRSVSMRSYADKPLVQKLGIKPHSMLCVVGAPAGFIESLDLPEGVRVVKRLSKGANVVHLFAKNSAALRSRMQSAIAALGAKGVLWVSWPKGFSGVKTDLTDRVIRDALLKKGLVDNKVCAVDQVWSGLRFTRRRTRSAA